MKLAFLIPNLYAYSECQETTNSCLKLSVRILIYKMGINTLDSRNYNVTLHKDVCLKPIFFFSCALHFSFFKI